MHTSPHRCPRPAGLLPRRCYWLLLFFSSFTWLSAQIRFDVFIGYDGTVREGTWFPVTCEVINSGPTFAGYIEVAPGPGAGGQTQRWPIELPTGTLKRIFIPAFANTRYAANWEVRLVDQRGKVREEVMARPQRQIGAETKLVGTLPRTAAGTVPLRSIKRNQPELQPTSARFQPDMLPDHPLLLEGLEAIYLNSERAPTLRQSQANALLAWLHAGGHLIVGVEQISDVTAVPWLRNLLPLELQDIVPLTQHGALADWVYHGTMITNYPPGPANRSAPRPVSALSSHYVSSVFGEIMSDPIFEAAELRIVTGKIRDGQVIVAEGHTPLLVEGTRGLGRITVLLFSPEREPFKSWKELPTFWTRLLGVPMNLYASSDYQQAYGFGLDGLFGAMIDSRQIHKLPIGWLLVLLVVYLIVIGPLDRIWLKKINRPMLTWITFPCYVALFSGLIYFIGYKLRAGESEYNELHLVNLLPKPQGSEWRGRTYASLYSPGNASYPLKSELKFATLRGEYQTSRPGNLSEKDLIEYTGDNFKAEAFVPVWTSQLYLSDWWHSAPAPVTATLKPAADHWQLTVQNSSRDPLASGWLAVEDWIFPVETIAPGQTKTVTLNRSSGQLRQAFITERLNRYENAARDRQYAFGRRDSGRIDDLPEACIVASLLEEASRPNNPYSGQNLIAPPGSGLTPFLARGHALFFAWSPNSAAVPGLNQFKSKRAITNTLWRLPLAIPQP